MPFSLGSCCYRASWILKHFCKKRASIGHLSGPSTSMVSVILTSLWRASAYLAISILIVVVVPGQASQYVVSDVPIHRLCPCFCRTSELQSSRGMVPSSHQGEAPHPSAKQWHAGPQKLNSDGQMPFAIAVWWLIVCDAAFSCNRRASEM
jgi:hypothetical protein